jgi:hypothetical protein
MRLDAKEIAHRRAPDVGDVSEAESEEVEEEGTAEREPVKERIIRVVSRIRAIEKVEVSMYEGNLEVEELLDWVRAIDKYFDYEEIVEEKKVKHAITRLKGHATLWWDELQVDRRCKGKQKMKSWDKMVAKLKSKFIPKYYQINMFIKLQNLRQKSLSVKEYTKEFYGPNIRVG